MTKAQRAEAKTRRMQLLISSHTILAKGVCPNCGSGIHRNLSLSGWWQCDRFGAPGFQKVAGPECGFQMFYDPTPEEHAAVLAAGQSENKAKVFGCPHCKSTEGFREKNVVLVDYDFEQFSPDGAFPDDSTYGESEVCWESAEAVKDEETYRCDACGKCFAEPVIVN